MSTNDKIAKTSPIRGHMPNCECIICGQNIPFSLPEHIVDQYIEGSLVIFAGAGISTENKNVLDETLYERLSWAYENKDYHLDFPKLMQKIESQPDGRLKLLSEIQERIEYVRSFPDLYYEATKFHRELATLWKIDTIVTTNWDDYFERECGAVPFIHSQDLAFWNAAKRRVLKIHGSFQSYGSIVASTTDYDQARKRLSKGVLGAQLKILLATKTIVFVGYSLRDYDFLDIYKLVSRELGGLKRQAYVVTPVASQTDENRFAKEGFSLIRTDGTFFVEKLKEVLATRLCALPDSRYSELEEILADVRTEHLELCDSVNFTKYPSALYCLYYQDGLIHGLERITNMRSSGEYSNIHLNIAKIQNYRNHRKLRLRQRRYGDVAYLDGYMEALYLILDNDPNGEGSYPVLFYAIGWDKQITSRSQFKKMLGKLAPLHKPAAIASQKYVRKIGLPIDGSIIIQHRVAT